MSNKQPATTHPITHRSVLWISVPIILSNLTIPLMGLIDTAVIGQLGSAVVLGAVGLGATIIGSIFWFFGFLRMATTGLAAQAHGSGDQAQVIAVLLRALLIAFGAGLFLFLAQIWLVPAAFKIAPASSEVEALATTYVHIRMYSAPAALAIYAMNGFFISTDRSAVLLLLQVVISALNVVLNIWFVLELGWGVEGVAWATVIAEIFGCCIGLIICFNGAKSVFRHSLRLFFDTPQLLKLFTISGDIFLRSFMLQIIFVSFTFLGSSFGDVELAANQVLFQFMHLVSYGLDGFAFAAEALVGQAVGRRDRAGVLRAIKLTGLWGGVLATMASVAIWFGATAAIDMITTAEDVRTMAKLFAIYAAMIPVLGYASWLLDGVFIGATRGADLRNMMAISMLGYGLFLMVLIPELQNHGLWIALLMSFVLRALTLASRIPNLLASLEGPQKT